MAASQVRIFRSPMLRPAALKEAVNKWLSENGHLQVVSISLVTTHTGEKSVVRDVLIHYEG